MLLTSVILLAAISILYFVEELHMMDAETVKSKMN